MRWVGSVKDISADEQRVDVLLVKGGDEPVKKADMLVVTTALYESCAEMPVGSVEDAHGC